MKKLLFSLATAFFSTVAFSQNYTEIQVVVKNYTDYNLYFAPRYNLGFWDGTNDNTFFGLPISSLGIPTPTTIDDLTYQQEGPFEMLPPQTTQQYSNGNTAIGVPLVPNAVDPVFNSSGPVMQGYFYEPDFFLKLMKLSWIRFAVSDSTLNNAAYGGGLAYGFDPSAMQQITPSPAYLLPFYKDANGEIYHEYWPSSLSFTAYGTTIYAQFITAPASGSNPATIHIVFWQ